MNENMVLKLIQPILHGENEITELTLRPITGKDMMGLKFELMARDGAPSLMIDAEQSFKLAYKLTGIPAPVLAQMIAPDVTNLCIELQTFLLSGQWTGRTQ